MSVDPSAVTAPSPGGGSSDGEKPTEAIGKYRLQEEIGSGGMGIVYRAVDPDLERTVAVKVLRSEATAPEMKTRLLREARAMARLRHPNVVTVFEVSTDKGRDFIVMEYVDGSTLGAWLGSQPSRRAIGDALLAAGRGLAAAHAAGLVHRDFKPHNILRSSDGHIYVTDFGLARGQIDPDAEKPARAVPFDPPYTFHHSAELQLEAPLTQTGVLIGTPPYMSPEQFAGAAPDPKSDQFAFCVTAWQALAGKRPFVGTSVIEIEAAVRAGPSELVADLPAPLRTVLERGLDPDPTRRWPDMSALLAALSDALEPPRDRRKLRWMIAGMASVLVAGVGVTTAVVMTRKSSSDDCNPKAFDSAWSPDRRAMLAKRGWGGMGAIVLLDDMKQRWTVSYMTACKAPKSEARAAQLRCLVDARDEVARILPAFEKTNNVDVGELAQLTATVFVCDPDSTRRGIPSFGPTPPTPPIPPAPAGWD